MLYDALALARGLRVFQNLTHLQNLSGYYQHLIFHICRMSTYDFSRPVCAFLVHI